MHAAETAPVITLALRPTGAVRLRVPGSLSATYSPRASAVRITRVIGEAMKAKYVPLRFIQPRKAAHATTAGAVSDRSPAAKPMPNEVNNKNGFTGYRSDAFSLLNASDPGHRLFSASVLSGMSDVFSILCRLLEFSSM